MLHRGWFPESITGERVVLRRHVPANLAAYRRWYGDPEVARLIGYRGGPMPAAQIDRFFQARAIGPDALALAIHIRASERLIGTCAFSQLDGDNGSALFHITIGEKDAWGQGYGREATELMLEHAFARLQLHRVALSVFAFNERAIRAYDKAGLRPRGPLARVDLARRPLLGRAPDERPRGRVAGPPGRAARRTAPSRWTGSRSGSRWTAPRPCPARRGRPPVEPAEPVARIERRA